MRIPCEMNPRVAPEFILEFPRSFGVRGPRELPEYICKDFLGDEFPRVLAESSL